MFKTLNPLLPSQLWLAIISLLVSNTTSDFKELKKVTKATAGNISVQIKKLEDAEYIKVTKGFLNNYQHTSIEITKKRCRSF